MKGTRVVPIVVVLVLFRISNLSAFVYSDTFFSLRTEIDISLKEDSDTTDLTVIESPRFDIDAVSCILDFGPESFPLDLRLRGGIGWFPKEPVRFIAGIELPLFERLNRFKAVAFGIYLAGDAVMEAKADAATLSGKASLSLLLPAGSMGGILCGVSVNHRGEFSLILGTANGGYPVVIIETGTEQIEPPPASGSEA